MIENRPILHCVTSSNVRIININSRQKQTKVCSAAPLSHPAFSQISFRAGIDLSLGTRAAMSLRHAHALFFLPALPFSLLMHHNHRETPVSQTEPVDLAVFDPDHQKSFLCSYKQYDTGQNQTNDFNRACCCKHHVCIIQSYVPTTNLLLFFKTNRYFSMSITDTALPATTRKPLTASVIED